MRQATELITILSAKAATGVGNNIDVGDYKTIVVEMSIASTPTLTVKCQGSISDSSPTFSSAQSATNHWDYIDMVDLEDNSSIDGDTGISAAGTADYRLFEVNVNGLKWLNFRVTAYTAGALTVKIRGYYE